jgi:hypothetical protein
LPITIPHPTAARNAARSRIPGCIANHAPERSTRCRAGRV